MTGMSALTATLAKRPAASDDDRPMAMRPVMPPHSVPGYRWSPVVIRLPLLDCHRLPWCRSRCEGLAIVVAWAAAAFKVE